MDVDSINEDTMDFSIQTFLCELWRDPRLNLTLFKSEIGLPFPDNLRAEIWTPDLVFDNAKSGDLFRLSVPNTGVRVLKGGVFYRSSRYNLKITCQMALLRYPMDIQHCFLKISLFSNPDHVAELHWAAEEDSPYKETFPESIKLTKSVEPLKYMMPHPVAYKEKERWTSGDYTYLYANFTFIRRLSGNLVNMYIPSTLVVVLSWLSFWLDIAAVPARITLGVTSLLTLSTQVVQSRGMLPPVNYMTALDIWLFVCILMVFSSIIEFAVAYQINIKSKKDVKTREVARLLSPSVGVHHTTQGGDRGNKKKTTRAFTEDRRVTEIPSDGIMYSLKRTIESFVDYITWTSSLDVICRALFPTAFLTFASVYWIYYLVLK